jgi:hypothetical protein
LVGEVVVVVAVAVVAIVAVVVDSYWEVVGIRVMVKVVESDQKCCR